MKSVDQVKQCAIVEVCLKFSDSTTNERFSHRRIQFRPRKNPSRSLPAFDSMKVSWNANLDAVVAVQSVRPGEKAPIWAKESSHLAANFLAEMRSHGGRFLSDAATSFQRRLVKANFPLLRYSYDKFQSKFSFSTQWRALFSGKTFIHARSNLKLNQLKLVAPDASVLPEIVDFTGPKPEEFAEKKQEELKKIEVEEKLVKKAEELETSCKQADQLNAKVCSSFEVVMLFFFRGSFQQ